MAREARDPTLRDQDESVVVRSAVDARNAADRLLNFGLAVRSWGVLAIVFGMGFAASTLGLRFEDAGEMQAPEFVSCLSFSSVMVIVGAVVYLVEHFTRRTVYGNVFTKQLPPPASPTGAQGSAPAAGPSQLEDPTGNGSA